MEIEVASADEMRAFGARLGMLCRGGEVIELVGDVGAGKTTLTKGLAQGMGVEDDVQSPTFTISRVYDARDSLRLAHYDFYRLHEAGIIEAELAEAIADPYTVTVIEWAEIVADALPKKALRIKIELTGDETRRLHLESADPLTATLIKELI